MATQVDIAPALGHGVVSSQTGPAAGYDAIDERRFWSVGKQEGVLTPGAWKMTPGGSALTVSVAANVDGALVQGDSVAAQGLYYVAPHTAAVTLDVSAGDASLPRLDQVVLEVLDNEHVSTGGLNVARLRVVEGTPTSGADRDNRSGAASLPDSAMLVGDLLVPAGHSGVFVEATHMRDRRTWGLGLGFSVSETSGNYIATTSYVQFTGAQRFELSGAPLEIWAEGEIWNNGATAGSSHSLLPMIDGAVPAEVGTTAAALPANQFGGAYNDGAAGAIRHSYGKVVIPSPAAGSHLIGIASKSSPAGGTVQRSASKPFMWGVREILAGATGSNGTS